MAYRNGNYAAFYVHEPFHEGNLGANAARDFVSYNLLRAWKGKDASFPYVDSHAKNYNVRDGSDWEKTLKPRIHDRLANSKNIVLFLSSITKNSRALREEIVYGVDTKGLPIIVVYPEFSEKSDIINCTSETFRKQVTDLWNLLPTFRERTTTVPSLHIPNKKALIEKALTHPDFQVATKGTAGTFFYSC